MQAEDNTLKIIDMVPIRRRGTGHPPGGRLEGVYGSSGWLECRLAVKLGIGFGSRNVNSRSDQQCRLRANIGQRVQLRSPSEPHSRTAEEEERDVAAQLGGQFHEGLYRQRC